MNGKRCEWNRSWPVRRKPAVSALIEERMKRNHEKHNLTLKDFWAEV